MLETRYMAFQPNFIPDMTAQTADRYVPFEGSTAGMMNAPDRGGLEDRDQPIRGDLESGGRMTAQIDWKAPAEYIADGAGRSEEHTSELQSLMSISYAAFSVKHN